MRTNIKAVTTFRQEHLGENKRLAWVDYAKGVGILLVVYGHVLREIRPVKGLFSNYANFFERSDKFIYSFHMPLFFILSGYFFMSSLYKKDFIYDKLKTLVYPFIIWSVLQTSAEILISYLSPYTNTQTPVTELITCIIMPRDQFWFLYALFFIMIVNYLLFRINVALGLYLSVGLWIIYLVFRRFVPDTFNNTFQFLIFFDVGIVLSQSRKFIYVIGRIKFLLANVVLFAVAEYFYLSGNFPFSSTALAKLLVGVSGAVLIIQLSRLAAERNFLNMLSYIGKRSLPVYLAHMLVASGTRIILLKILKINNLTINCIAGTLAGIFLPLLLYSMVKKSGYTAWLFTFPQKANRDRVIRTHTVINPA
jgi:fucose 4-O-acetylase-like acetyltransferase